MPKGSTWGSEVQGGIRCIIKQYNIIYVFFETPPLFPKKI